MDVQIVGVVDEGLGHTAHLVAVDGEVTVIDPLPEAGTYHDLARQHGWRLRRSADTHLHADHISGGPDLAAGGVDHLAPAAAGLLVGHRPIGDGDEVDLGGPVRLRALATPGHTPDHLAYLLVVAGEPVAVFTGGSLMVGTVGRPDLRGDAERARLARAMWHSLHERLLVLPDDVAVHPTHGAGSFCSAPGSAERATTIGAERRTNPLLAVDDPDEFAARLLAGLDDVPRHFLRLPDLNRKGGPAPPPHPWPELSPEQVDSQVRRGAQLVDVRPVAAFAAGHVPTAIAHPLRPVFAPWAAWLLDPDRPLIFVADAATDRDELARQCRAVGLGNVAGELAGGMTAWRSEERPETTVEVVDAADITWPLLDVRQPDEYRAGYVPGAVNVPLGDLADAAVDPTGPWTVMCGHGERAATAAGLLARAGHRGVRVVRGGPHDWSTATGRPLQAA